jgi:DNA end-binding protein Ku
MAARATSSGTISFGLVSIPIKLYTATQSRAVHFNMLDPRDKSRVKQQYVSAATGEAVERGELVRGYEYARGQFVVLTDEELQALEKKSDRSIEIAEFVPMDKVDPVYFDKAQLLGPDKGGAKAYRLLNEAMTAMGVVAIGRYNARGRQQLVLIRPVGRGLMLHGLFYADEVRSFDDVEFGDEVQIQAKEFELASQLIEQLASKRFDAERYEDEYRRAVLEVVERKVAGEEVVLAPAAEPREQIIDLVAALKESLARRGAAEEAPGEGAAPGRARKPARAKGKAASGKGARRKSASR